MISANNITLRLGKKALFEDVNIKFTNKTHPITTPPYKVNSFSFKIKNLFKSLLS